MANYSIKIYIEEGTKDEKKAFVRAKGWLIRGKSAEELGLYRR